MPKHTSESLEAIFEKLIETASPKRTKVSVSAVAQAAGINRTTLYRSYPQIVQQIIDLKKIERSSSLMATKAIEQTYKSMLETAQAEIQSLARINHRLNSENITLVDQLRKNDELIEIMRSSNKRFEASVGLSTDTVKVIKEARSDSDGLTQIRQYGLKT